ncbi:MAG: AAA family ATPase, partial [Thermoplasmata archaeon]|nr:AAA family ATPase [Thermoplasmata archaeon]
MDGCVGRAKELEYLSALWEKVPVSCAVCGRRHLGKTALLKEFTKDKDHIYITGTQGLRSDNLEEINRALTKFSGKRERIADIDDLFPKLKEVCGRRKVVVIIDKLSDLAENFEEVNIYLRNFINREMNGTKIMLVVCDNDNSLFGRFYYTLEMK